MCTQINANTLTQEQKIKIQRFNSLQVHISLKIIKVFHISYP